MLYVAFFMYYAFSPIIYVLPAHGIKSAGREISDGRLELPLADIISDNLEEDAGAEAQTPDGDFILLRKKRAVIRYINLSKLLLPNVSAEGSETVVGPKEAPALFTYTHEPTGALSINGFVPPYSGHSPPAV